METSARVLLSQALQLVSTGFCVAESTSTSSQIAQSTYNFCKGEWGGWAGREIGKGGSKRGRDGERDGKGERERGHGEMEGCI